jgi:hypothetical protein
MQEIIRITFAQRSSEKIGDEFPNAVSKSPLNTRRMPIQTSTIPRVASQIPCDRFQLLKK